MTDEEKKAIEYLKEIYNAYESFFGKEDAEKCEDCRRAKTLVKLIEKQSKEIEELKREKVKRSWVHIKENGEVEPLFYVSKDKIKAKIEEVEQWELYNMKISRLNTLDERLGAKIGIKYVLQSLLEKE